VIQTDVVGRIGGASPEATQASEFGSETRSRDRCLQSAQSIEKEQRHAIAGATECACSNSESSAAAAFASEPGNRCP
jgi:hypothetical protein